MTVGAEKRQTLLERGVTLEEVADWEASTRQRLLDAGATQTEVADYFGEGPVDFGAIKQAAANDAEEAAAPREAKGLKESFAAGFQTSLTGLAARKSLPDIMPAEKANLFNSIATAAGQFAGDVPVVLPTFASMFGPGAAVGGTAAATTRNPLATAVGSTAGGLAAGGFTSGFVSSTLRESMIKFLRDNPGKDPSTFDFAVGSAAQFLTTEVQTRALKEGAIEAGGALLGGPVGGRLVVSKASPLVREIGVGTAELASSMTVAAAIEGELPDANQFGAMAAVAVAGGLASGSIEGAVRRTPSRNTGANNRDRRIFDGILKRVEDVFARDGKTPKETVERAEVHPVDREALITGDGLKEPNITYIESPKTDATAFGQSERLRFDQGKVDPDFVAGGETAWSKYARAGRGKRPTPPARLEGTDLVPFTGGKGGGKKPPPDGPDRPANQDDIDAIMGKVKPGETDKNSRDIDDLRFELIDDLQFAKSFAASAYKAATGKSLPIESNPGEMLALARGGHAIGEQHVVRGVFDRGTGKKISPSLQDIYKTLKTPEQKRAWRAYLISRRALEKEGQGKPTGFDLEASKRIVESGNKSGAVVDSTSDLRVWDRTGIEWVTEAGMLSKKSAAKIVEQNADYVPFFTVMTDRGKGASVRGIPVRPVVKEFKGGKIDIVDPIEAMVKNRFHMIQIAENNRARRRFVDWNNSVLPDEFKLLDRVTPFPRGKGPRDTSGVETIFGKDAEFDNSRLPGEDKGVPAIIDDSEAKRSLILEKEFGDLRPIDSDKSLVTVDQNGKAEIITIEDLVKDSRPLQDFLDNNGMTSDDLTWVHVAPELEARSARRGEIVVFEDGKPIVYRARDPRLAQAFERLTPAEHGLLTRMLSIPARTVRAGVTALPTFVIPAAIRDTLDAVLINSFKTTPFVTAIDGLVQATTRTATFERFVANGGSGTALINIDADVMRQSMLAFEDNQLFGGGQTTFDASAKKIRNAGTAAFRLIYAQGMLSDQLTRVGRFKLALEEGLSGEQAAIQGRLASLDFSQAGASMRAINSIVTFLGPSMNGIDRSVLAAGRHPKKLMAAGLGFITLPSIMLWAAFSGEEWYQNLDERDKARAWWVRVGGTPSDPLLVPIPKPHAWVTAFANAPVLALEASEKDNPDLGKEILAGLAREFVVDPTEITATKWISDIAANHDGYLDAPIVPQRLERSVLPQYRFTPYTTEVAKEASRLLPDFIPERFRTPIAIEHMIGGLTGTRGDELLRLADSVLGTLGLVEKSPTSRDQFMDSRFVRTFFRTGPQFRAPINEFFDNASFSRQLIGTQKELILQGDVVEANKINQAYGPLMLNMQNAEQGMGTIFKMIRMVEFNDTIPIEEKQQLVDQYMKLASENAKIANSLFDEARKRQKELDKK